MTRVITHIPVMAQEMLLYLNPKENETIIDCTVGSGGHAREILERTAPKGIMLALDWDADAIKEARNTLRRFKNRVILEQESYTRMQELAQKHNITHIDGALLDLGLSSTQLANSGRGFSFQKKEPIDMRFNINNPITAERIVNFSNRHELAGILKEYGEERFAGSIANAIVQSRVKKHITTTAQLVSIIEDAVPYSYKKMKPHYAQKTFQAIRIAVNNELENLEQGLRQAEQLLAKNGRLVVISFHSLEDRIVKQFFKESSLEVLTKKPVMPSALEIRNNPRARSAKLRAAIKR